MKNWLRKKKNWSGFFANLLGVILGITLTFGINALWQRHEEKKKTREILILVRNELETNKRWFQKQENLLRAVSDAYKKILEAENNWSTIPDDSLAIYVNLVCGISLYQLTTSAWQIFQNSEIIQKMSDKELVIRLTDCYFGINTFYDFIMNNYWNKKFEMLPEESNELYEILDELMKNKKSLRFLSIMSTESYFWDIFPQAEAVIDYTIALLDKYGDLRYDMEAKDKEFISFVQARIDSAHRENDANK